VTRAVLGVIGGSGIYDLSSMTGVQEIRQSTPWGEPSDLLVKGRIGATDVVFLSRHGRGHRLAPAEINYRANIDALKRAGVTDLVSLSACGSFKETLSPGTFVLPDQIIDRTYGRDASFFGNGCVAHVSMAKPIAPTLQALVLRASQREGTECTRGGTAVCMQGPQFSTLAESLAYRQAGYDVINMTCMPEAKLAREAEISYALLAMVTDFDCWHPDHAAIDVAALIGVLKSNAGRAAALIRRLAEEFPAEHPPCPIGSDRALDTALITDPGARSPALLAKLDAVAGRILGTNSQMQS
jgi:5'-methylthioadenosine phosphorylase